jgi:hypothetical protein
VVKCRNNWRLSNHPPKLARFQQYVFLLQLQQSCVIFNTRKNDSGVWRRETVFYCAIGAQSAQLPSIMLYKVGMRGKQNLKISLIISSGCKNFVVCEIAPHKPPTCLEGCTPIFHFKGFSLVDVTIGISKNHVRLKKIKNKKWSI